LGGERAARPKPGGSGGSALMGSPSSSERDRGSCFGGAVEEKNAAVSVRGPHEERAESCARPFLIEDLIKRRYFFSARCCE
jgi:hypothetical protein